MNGTGHDAQCCKCFGMTRWTGTTPTTTPRCQWCGSVDLLAWCSDHDPQRRVFPDMDSGRLEWSHLEAIR